MKGKLLAYVITILMIAGMAYGLTYQVDGLVTLCVAINWMLCILAIPVGFVTIAAAVLYEKATGKQRDIYEKALADAGKKKSLPDKLFGWVTFIGMTVLFAWGGWIVTAIVYVLASVFMRLAKSIAKDEAVKQGLA
ncbi:hypothetical protein [Pantoea sp. ME81]|uniref:hypothetical protein n=1 Tax=Pantoea sp. ME81 TaxID=2743935 RepID=UPI0015F490FF|nr:hypothetical protein [Pantoea sp. ME81]